MFRKATGMRPDPRKGTTGLHCIALLLFLLTLGACNQERPFRYEIKKSALSGTGMVVSAHPLASMAGSQILGQGGNAIDAAVATHFALAVVHPRAGNIGGGGFLVFREADGSCHALDFREKAPIAARRDMYLDSAGQVIAGMSLAGPLAVAVPGSVAGMGEAHRKFGSVQWEVLLAPAISYAERGYAITAKEAQRLNAYGTEFEKWNGGDLPFVKSMGWKEGDILVQPELAQTLKRIARKGPEEFYTGETASMLLSTMDSLGGILDNTDLQDYSPVWRTPLQTRYKAFNLITMPLPSSGGIVLAQIFEILERFEVGKLQQRSVGAVHLITEAERRAFADRAKYLGDPDQVEVPLLRLLDSVYLAGRMATFSPDSATPSSAIRTGTMLQKKEHYETTHISIADQYGNTAAETTTLNGNYGSKVYVRKAGFFLNNEMDDFSAKPGAPNMFGLVGDEANAIAPEKRMLSSMTPSIIEKDGQPYLILGAPGGPTIITSILQVFLNTAEFGMSLDSAIAERRFHHQWLPDEIVSEEGAFNRAVADSLQRMGHTLRKVVSMGSVNAILIEGGKYHGSADIRADDHAEPAASGKGGRD